MEQDAKRRICRVPNATRTVAAALCVGLILSIVVAALCSLAALPSPEPSVVVFESRGSPQSDLGWDKNAAKGLLSSLLNHETANSYVGYTSFAAVTLAEKTYTTSWESVSTAEFVGLHRLDRAGWPLRCLESELHAQYDPVNGTWKPLDADHAWPTQIMAWIVEKIEEPNAEPMIVDDAALIDGRANGRIIPMGVRWVPLAGNTLFYAALTASGLWSYRHRVRQRRIRRGLCPVCAFDSAGLPRCPECGDPSVIAQPD